MKKGLSILLVAAALFGFYGSAVNLNDILACKDYWEEAGEKSTADMNKLEDGLNQLKDNEQAYLDGVEQVAEGEQALEDAEAQLAAGEQALRDGEAQLAQGEADYAAAPGKLAAGERALAEGEKSYKDLKALISGLNTVKKHGTSTTKKHNKYWHDAFSHTVSDSVLQKIAAGEETDDSPGLQQARQVITATVSAKKGTLDTAASLGGMTSSLSDKILGAKTYAQFDKALESGIQPLKKAADTLDGLSAKASGAVEAKKDDFEAAKAALADDGSTLALLKQVQGGLAKLSAAGYGGVNVSALPDQLPDGTDLSTLKKVCASKGWGPTVDEAKATVDQAVQLYSAPKQVVAAGINAALAELGGADSLSMVKSLNEDLFNSLQKDLAILTCQVEVDNATFSATIDQFASDMMTLAGALKAAAKEARSTADTFGDWNAGYDKLESGKNDQLASTTDGIPYAFGQMLSNSTIKSAIKTYDKGLLKELKKYAGSNKNKLKDEDLDKFDDDLVYIAKKIIPRAQKVLARVKSNAERQLADGRRQLAQGKRDYAAAPGKLAQGRQQLAEGRAQLEDGYQQYNDGVAQLEDGKAQLAQYEDGEQQVRDGLAQLVGTEPDLGLESILDRLNGDDDFDNGDNHLDLDEGLNAVDVGRGYQSDDGVLITNEIMARAVGTGALLGAGALAVIAALLSFLKKNKAAGVFAALTAAAGAFGAIYGTNAGTYFSDIAGSTAGSAAWVAAGALGVVALVHAIVHFAAPKNV